LENHIIEQVKNAKKTNHESVNVNFTTTKVNHAHKKQEEEKTNIRYFQVKL